MALRAPRPAPGRGLQACWRSGSERGRVGMSAVTTPSVRGWGGVGWGGEGAGGG